MIVKSFIQFLRKGPSQCFILAQLMTIAIEGSEPELVDFDAGLEIIKLAIKHSWALHMKMFSPFFSTCNTYHYSV